MAKSSGNAFGSHEPGRRYLEWRRRHSMWFDIRNELSKGIDPRSVTNESSRQVTRHIMMRSLFRANAKSQCCSASAMESRERTRLLMLSASVPASSFDIVE
ncbi:hypothetical protein PBRA_002767 [Plasmodiophora brassicae]|uniref:Uncharacterized protein n=1 Tax=Plasmodiophora brassicae TaxID=37360 RepID=A0A0G4J5G2_PLABS|nr:hypothetical protein PBRA_002767 [Plasmodiophora brassicae]